MSVKSLSIRIDNELLDKIHVVSDYEDRSANGQIIALIKKCVEEYEAKHGKIKL
ncbi:MAG: ParD-like family protein [Oscillospiraceae bacterium]|nr:ParD-like family protein [Oscillospiraceae bacterium]